MQVFLSYNERSHAEAASSIEAVLTAQGIRVWHDKRARKSARRLISRRRGEFGLDSWLRRGIMASDMIVALIPYGQVGEMFPFGGEGVQRMPRPLSAPDIVNRVWRDVTELQQFYAGDVPGEANQPDQLAYYAFQPIHWLRSSFYDDRFGVALGKDPFESWRFTEMRTAGAFSLMPVAVVPIEEEDDGAAAEVAAELAEDPVIAVVRMADLAADVERVLVPTIHRRAPGVEQQEKIRLRKKEFRRLKVPAFIRGAAIGIVGIIGIVLFALAALVSDLLKFGWPFAVAGLVVYLVLSWIGVL